MVQNGWSTECLWKGERKWDWELDQNQLMRPFIFKSRSLNLILKAGDQFLAFEAWVRQDGIHVWERACRRQKHGGQSLLSLYSEDRGQKSGEHCHFSWLKCWQVETTYPVNLLRWNISPPNNGGKLLYKVIETVIFYLLLTVGFTYTMWRARTYGQGDPLRNACARAGTGSPFPPIASCSAHGYSGSCVDLLLNSTCFFSQFFFVFFFLWSKHSLSLCLRVSMVKNLPAMQQTWVWPQDQEDPLEKEMETHSSILAWRIPWTEKPGRLQSMGLQRVKHDWATNTAHISFWIYFTLLHPQDNGRESPISYLWRLWGSSQDTQWCWPYREQVHLPKTTPQPSLCARQERAEGGGRGPSVFCVTYHRQQNINWDPVLWLLNSEHFLPSNTHFKQNTTLIKVTILFMTSLAWVMENPLAWVMEK